jgi:hypothetical protein
LTGTVSFRYSSSSGFGAIRVHNTTLDESGSPEATPSVNGVVSSRCSRSVRPLVEEPKGTSPAAVPRRKSRRVTVNESDR